MPHPQSGHDPELTDALTLSDQLFIAAEECARHYLRHVFDGDPGSAAAWAPLTLLGIEQRDAINRAQFGGQGTA